MRPKLHSMSIPTPSMRKLGDIYRLEKDATSVTCKMPLSRHAAPAAVPTGQVHIHMPEPKQMECIHSQQDHRKMVLLSTAKRQDADHILDHVQQHHELSRVTNSAKILIKLKIARTHTQTHTKPQSLRSNQIQYCNCLYTCDRLWHVWTNLRRAHDGVLCVGGAGFRN